MMPLTQQVKCELAVICAMNPAHISEDALLIQYGLDSVRSLELVVALEEQFNIEVEDNELHRIRKVSDVLSLVEKKVNLN